MASSPTCCNASLSLQDLFLLAACAGDCKCSRFFDRRCLSCRRRRPRVLSVSREQIAQQLLLRGFVAGQHALELLAQLGSLVSTRARVGPLRELILPRTRARPERNR